MNTIYYICIGLSVGTIAGFLAGSIKWLRNRKYSEERIKKTRRIIDKVSLILKFLTLFFLIMGLIWCMYFLILGAFDPAQTDYANSMSDLIVSVLTVISIIFAFVEFSRRSEGKK